MIKPERNDPCWCKSGKKYKKCHMLIDNKSGLEKVQASEENYINKWEKSATNFESSGCYKWMIDQIKYIGPKRILEIGCGDGTALKNIIREIDPLFIVSLEDNNECIRVAAKKLSKDNIGNVKIYKRYKKEMLSNDMFNDSVVESELKLDSKINIIEANVIFDTGIIEFLKTQEKFDLVVVWLIGTHTMQKNCQNLTEYEIKTVNQYRLHVQNKVYEMADVLLRKGGVLQVVDRSEIPDKKELTDDLINSHKEQASVTTLEVLGLKYYEYKELEEKGKMGLKITVPDTGRIPNLEKTCVISVVSEKR